MFAATTSPPYSPTWVGGDADRLEADPLDPRAPPGGDQQAVAAELAPVLELQDAVVALAAGRGGVDADVDLDAFPAQGRGERLAERRWIAGEHVRRALHQRHLAAEAVDDLGKLQAGRPTAQDDEAPGDLRHARGLASAPEPRELAQARHRGDDGVGAARDHDVLGRVRTPST